MSETEELDERSILINAAVFWPAESEVKLMVIYNKKWILPGGFLRDIRDESALVRKVQDHISNPVTPLHESPLRVTGKKGGRNHGCWTRYLEVHPFLLDPKEQPHIKSPIEFSWVNEKATGYGFSELMQNAIHALQKEGYFIPQRLISKV